MANLIPSCDKNKHCNLPTTMASFEASMERRFVHELRFNRKFGATQTLTKKAMEDRLGKRVGANAKLGDKLSGEALKDALKMAKKATYLKTKTNDATTSNGKKRSNNATAAQKAA